MKRGAVGALGAWSVRILAFALLLAPRGSPGATWLGLVDTGQLFVSADAGATWTVRAALPVRDAVSLQARTSSTDLFLATRTGVVYRSEDAGVSWTARSAVPASDLAEMLILNSGAILLAGSTGTLYRSADAGVTFAAFATLTGSNFVSLTRNTDSFLYALTRTGEVYESTDVGSSWTARGALAVSNAVRIRAAGGVLYVLTETGEVARSANGGQDWNFVGTLSQTGMRGLTVDAGELVAATREGHAATSPDGVEWTWRGSLNQLQLVALAVDTPAVSGFDPPASSTGLWMSVPWPNPSRGGAATFAFRLDRGERVELELYDVGGRVVARRAAEVFAAGLQRVRWEPFPVQSGHYVARLRTSAGRTATQRWVVIR